MNEHVGGPGWQVVMLACGKSTRARMTRIGTVRRDLFVMRDAGGKEFIAKHDDHGVLVELTVYEAFEEIEGLSRALATVEKRDLAKLQEFADRLGPTFPPPAKKEDFIPHLDHVAADEDYVRPNFCEDAKVFL